MKAYICDVFHRCESITDWIPTNGSLSVSSSQKVEGKYSVKLTSDSGTSSSMGYYDRTVNWMEFTEIVFSVYHPGWTNEKGAVTLFTDITNWKCWEFNFAASWTEIVIDISSTPFSSMGSLDLSNITYIIFTDPSSEDPGEDYYFDFMYARKEITSDIYHGLSFIETSIRDFAKLEFMAKGTWEIKKNYTIVIYDNYTSNGVTTEQIIFEGNIVDYDLY